MRRITMKIRSHGAILFLAVCCFLEVSCGGGATTAVSGVTNPVQFQPQAFQRPESCLPCHQRQFDELRQAVKAGYRNVSPLFNGLEAAGNLINGGLLRPVYSDS